MSPAAEADLEDIWDFIAQDKPDAADAFLDTILEKCQTLADSPEMGRHRDELAPGVRSLPFKRYVIFYTKTDIGIEVIRVLSGYRDVDQIF